MPFDTTFRYIAFDSQQLAEAALLRATHGDNASTGPSLRNGQGATAKTLLCGLDNTDTGKLRAMALGVDAIPVTLTDGRYVLGGYWTVAAVEAFGAGKLDGEELTELEVRALIPTVEI